MIFYEVALLSTPLAPLTYSSQEEIQIGTKVLVKLQRRVKLQEAAVVKRVEKPTFRCNEIVQITQYIYNTKMIEIANFISTYYVSSLGIALNLFKPFDMIKKKNIEYKIDCDIVLSSYQKKAYEFLKQNSIALLFANTGSGKTEIYIKLLIDTIVQNKQALLLLPEISLSPQMQKRLKKIFNTSVAIWHSKITNKKKKEILEQLQNGTIKIIAGARSALFLPYDNLGLIVVDEEHDDSYKSNSTPQYNAKDLSLYIGKKYNIQVVLGSATPSLNSYSKIPYFRLNQTYFKTKKNYIYDNSDLGLNDMIFEKIKNVLDKNEQVIIFLPTRANFKYQICKECGKSVQCPFCSVSLSLHKNKYALQCHYCNYTQVVPKYCPSCQIGLIENFRIGTAEITYQLKEYFKENIIKTFDRDNIKTNKELNKILKEFNDNKIDILVGTQMLSKGHDYHNVTLAVVLGIDSILNMTSYRVREKALSLLLQISGRSGRKGEGDVIIQTKNQNFFHHYLTNSDYEEFLKDELNNRKELYPPNVRLCRVQFSHKNSIIAKEELDKNIYLAKQQKTVELIGFGQSGIFKLANKYRYEMLLRAKDIKPLLEFLHLINKENVSIDMDSLY